MNKRILWEEISLRYLIAEKITDGPHETPIFLDSGIPFLSVDGIKDGEIVFNGERYISEEQHEEFIKKARPQKNDILMGKSASTGKIARVKDEFQFSIWSPLALIRPDTEKIDPRYLEYSMKSATVQDQIENLCTSSTQKNISMDAIPRIKILYPPMKIQILVGSFLDKKSAELDQLIGAKLRLLKLLDEKKCTLIARAVTRGLNPDVPLKDSGIPWLGMIPAHWEIQRTKWLLPEIDDRSETGEEDLLSVSHLTGVTLRSEKDVNMFMAESLEGYKKCKAGDLVINTLWAWMGAMGVSPVDGIISPAYNVYRPVSGIDPDYIDLLVRTPDFVCEITRYSKGVWSSRLRLYPEGLYEACLPVPPLSEQKKIVVEVSSQQDKLNKLKSITEKTIALLQERRTALISAAVTGKLGEEVLNAS